RRCPPSSKITGKPRPRAGGRRDLWASSAVVSEGDGSTRLSDRLRGAKRSGGSSSMLPESPSGLGGGRRGSPVAQRRRSRQRARSFDVISSVFQALRRTIVPV